MANPKKSCLRNKIKGLFLCTKKIQVKMAKKEKMKKSMSKINRFLILTRWIKC